MSRVRCKNTRPEMLVRRLIHGMGYRYRLHISKLPGHPDIVFPGKKKIVFVHGCFWHGHACALGRVPKSNVEFWVNKICGNKRRDEENIRKLGSLGWGVLVVWECEIKDVANVKSTIKLFLNGANHENRRIDQ